jgi:hypothetical protein
MLAPWSLAPTPEASGAWPTKLDLMLLTQPGIINSIFKPKPEQKHTRSTVYNVLGKPTSVYGSKAWIIKKKAK